MNVEKPNAEQAEYWNEVAGPKWVHMQEALDAQIESFGIAMLKKAALQPGERVLDVGCGCGATTLEIAGRVGPSGSVIGIDLSRPMLARARSRLSESGLTNATFVQDDAQACTLESGAYDVVVSRFGVMFFADPVAAFTNLRGALKPGGRLCFICWRALQENAWMLVSIGAVADLVELPAPPELGAPGPFSLADEAHVRGMLEAAGFASIAIEKHDQQMVLGKDTSLEDAVEFFFYIGPLSTVLGEASPEQQDAVRKALRTAFEPYYTGDGVTLPAATWVVTAQAG